MMDKVRRLMARLGHTSERRSVTREISSRQEAQGYETRLGNVEERLSNMEAARLVRLQIEANKMRRTYDEPRHWNKSG